jgi:hypothetical protein
MSFSRVPDSFVDRDMMMRYHWGLGVGHLYSHQPIHSHDGGTTATALMIDHDSDRDDDGIQDRDSDSINMDPIGNLISDEHLDDDDAAPVNEEDCDEDLAWSGPRIESDNSDPEGDEGYNDDEFVNLDVTTVIVVVD